MARKLRRRLGIDAEVGNLTGTTMNVRKLIVPPKSTPVLVEQDAPIFM